MCTGKTRYPNVLLIVIDSLRADHLDICRGSNGVPNIDGVASEGVVFDDAYSTWNTTDQSLTTILTGKYPLSHGIIHHGDRIEHRDLVTFHKTRTKTLAEILRQHEYETMAVDWMGRWFRRGFNHYDMRMERNPIERFSLYLKYVTRHIDIFRQYTNGRRFGIPSLKDARGVLRTFSFSKELAQIQDAALVTDSAIRLIEGVGEDNFFLFLHYWDTHTPYHCPRGYQSYRGSDRRKRVVSRYAGAAQYVDRQLGGLFRELRGRGLWDNTILILTADHGESLTEHDIFFDHHGLYDVTTHVPLIFRYPGIAAQGKRVRGFVQHTDVLPTILEILNIDANGFHLDGRSLIPLIENEVTQIRPFVYCEESYVQRKRAIRTNRYKYIYATDGAGYCSYCHTIHGGAEELYDLKDDPFEQVNIVDKNKNIRDDLRKKLDDYVIRLSLKTQGETRQQGGGKIYLHGPEAEEKTKRRLQSLGYMN